MKENNGRAARRKQAKRLAYLAGGSLLFLFLFLWLSPSNNNNGNGNSNNNNNRSLRDTALSKTRQLYANVNANAGAGAAAALGISEKAMKFRQHLNAQFYDIDQGELLQQVLHGKLHLIDLEVIEEDLLRAPSNSYAGVYGVFCKLNWDLHKQDPSRYPMFRDIVSNSPDCDGDQHDPYYLDIQKIAKLAPHHYEKHNNLLNLTAVVFHESRCGSTLIANNLIAMNPTKHRVYSESAPAAAALRSVCGETFTRCSHDQAVDIFRDVVTVMSLTDSPETEQRVFFKFQSITTKFISIFQEAFPHVPWMFVYRDPVQVMMSHFKDTGDLSRAICTRSQRQKTPPRDIQAIAHAHDYSSAKEMSYEEYCAAHLASITDAAVHALQNNAMGIPINYNQLPDILWETILPKQILGQESLTQEEIQNMQSISQQYSKGRGTKHQEFEEDSQAKEQAATPAIQRAAKEYLHESFYQLSNYQSPRIF